MRRRGGSPLGGARPYLPHARLDAGGHLLTETPAATVYDACAKCCALKIEEFGHEAEVLASLHEDLDGLGKLERATAAEQRA